VRPHYFIERGKLGCPKLVYPRYSLLKGCIIPEKCVTICVNGIIPEKCVTIICVNGIIPEKCVTICVNGIILEKCVAYLLMVSYHRSV
jgi:hypothetical protein